MPEEVTTLWSKYHNWLHEIRERWRNWFVARAHGAHARAWLIFFSFSESSFFIVLPEVLMLPILIVDGTRWLYYAFITTASSLLGGIFGYVVGAFLFDLIGEFIVSTYHLEGAMAQVAELYSQNAFWAIFTGAFTPIPYKIFTISAGFFSINFIIFLLASILGRGLRYFALAFLAKKYGRTFGAAVYKYFNLATTVVIIAFVAVVIKSII